MANLVFLIFLQLCSGESASADWNANDNECGAQLEYGQFLMDWGREE